MNDDHDRVRRLVLSLDDLEGPQREHAQAHVDACAECRALLHHVRSHEQAPAQLAALGARAFDPAAPAAPGTELSPQEQRDADASLAALRARGSRARGSPARRSPARHPGRRRWVWAAPLAVAAALLVLVMRPSDPGELARGSLRVVPSGAQRGSVTGEWRTGDAFSLQFEIRKPAYPVVIHVDPRGRAELLHPPAAGELSPLPSPAGAIVLPPADGGERWVLEGEPGTETFLVAAPRGRPSQLETMLLGALQLPGGTASREAQIEALREAMRRELGAVQVVEVQHEP